MFQRSEDKEQQPFAVFPPARDMPYTINNSHTTLTYNMLPFLCFQEPHDCGSLGFFLPPLVAPPTEVTGLRPPAGALVAEAGAEPLARGSQEHDGDGNVLKTVTVMGEDHLQDGLHVMLTCKSCASSFDGTLMGQGGIPATATTSWGTTIRYIAYYLLNLDDSLDGTNIDVSLGTVEVPPIFGGHRSSQKVVSSWSKKECGLEVPLQVFESVATSLPRVHGARMPLTDLLLLSLLTREFWRGGTNGVLTSYEPLHPLELWRNSEENVGSFWV